MRVEVACRAVESSRSCAFSPRGSGPLDEQLVLHVGDDSVGLHLTGTAVGPALDAP